MAFTLAEREALGLTGRLPSAVLTLDQQAQRAYQQLHRQGDDLAKNVYLEQLHDRNEVLYFKVLLDHLTELLPVVYDPVVGDAIERYSHEYRRPRGIYLSIDRPDDMEAAFGTLGLGPGDVDLIVCSDAEEILGIGDWGVGGIQISVGKLAVYTAAAGIDPRRVIPVSLDVGTDNEALLNDPLYLGNRHARVRGQDYDAFIARYLEVASSLFPDALLHFEDFGAGNARRILLTYRDRYRIFNDDMQGTGAIVKAGLFNALRVAGTRWRDQRVVIFGGGTAGVGIADQIRDQMARDGLDAGQATGQVWIVDLPGLVHVEGLPLPQQLAPQRLAHRRGIVLPDIGENGAAVRRRRVDHGEVADAGQRHLQGARDRAGREGQHVDALGHALHGLLVRHSEALLLVDHQEPELLELHVLGQEAVGADDDVDAPVGQALHDGTLLGRREEPAEQFHPNRIGRVALGEGLGVLARQQRRRSQHRSLGAVLHRLEDGPHRNLRLAEPDVAAHQAVHGARLFHVALDVGDRPQLVLGLDEPERGLHLRLPGRVRAERSPPHGKAAPVQLDQLGRDFAGRGARPGAGPLPVRTAHLRQRRRFAAAVGRDRLDLLHRQVQAVGPPVLQDQVVPGGPAHGPRGHALEAGHPVLAVDDEAPRLEVVEEPVRRSGPRASSPVRHPAARHIGLREHGHLGIGEDEPARDRCRHDGDPGRAGCRLEHGRADPLVGQGRGESAPRRDPWPHTA